MFKTKSFLMEGRSHYFSVGFSGLLCGRSPRTPHCEFPEHQGAVSRQCPLLQVQGSCQGWRSHLDPEAPSVGPTDTWYTVKLPSLTFCIAVMVLKSRAGAASAQHTPEE